MRLRIPLVPIAIRVQCERRPLGPLRPQLSVLGLLIITALIAGYMTRVTLPERKKRFQIADQVISDQIALFLRAAEGERAREREIRRRLKGCLAAAEKEENEAKQWAEGSEKRQIHARLAQDWIKAARNVPMPFADLAARKALALERRAEELRKGQRQSAEGIAYIESLARSAEKLPDTPEWQRLELAPQLELLKSEKMSEQEAKLVKTFLASKHRGSMSGR
ncbi:hypothetical protein SAMN05444166_2821 [Singulisphaera sp. GP187]|nr:hypothetical protein SAMN05444166_2821 [Singulisphaera sp. GP187]